MTNEQIFEHIGLTRDEIQACTSLRKLPNAAIALIDRAKPYRPLCPVCGKRINAQNCQPIKTT